MCLSRHDENLLVWQKLPPICIKMKNTDIQWKSTSDVVIADLQHFRGSAYTEVSGPRICWTSHGSQDEGASEHCPASLKWNFFVFFHFVTLREIMPSFLRKTTRAFVIERTRINWVFLFLERLVFNCLRSWAWSEVLLAALGADPVTEIPAVFTPYISFCLLTAQVLPVPVHLFPIYFPHRSSSCLQCSQENKPTRGVIALLKAFSGLVWHLGERPGSLLGLRLPLS